MRHDHETHEYVPATTRNGWQLGGLPSVGDLFQSFFSPAFLGSSTGASMPSLDLTETADGYKMDVDVPGYTMDQINVQFQDNVLTLTGEHAGKVAESGDGKKCDDSGRCHIVERTRGSFSRSIKFPVPVDAVNVKAALKNGVLTVTIPKSAAARAQKIKITEA